MVDFRNFAYRLKCEKIKESILQRLRWLSAAFDLLVVAFLTLGGQESYNRKGGLIKKIKKKINNIIIVFNDMMIALTLRSDCVGPFYLDHGISYPKFHSFIFIFVCVYFVINF